MNKRWKKIRLVVLSFLRFSLFAFFFFLLFFDMNGKENLVIKHKQCKKLTQTKIKKQNKNLITYLKSLMSNPFHEI